MYMVEYQHAGIAGSFRAHSHRDAKSTVEAISALSDVTHVKITGPVKRACRAALRVTWESFELWGYLQCPTAPVPTELRKYFGATDER